MCSSFGTHYQHSFDHLGLVLMPSLHLFASALFLQDGSRSTGDSTIEKMSLVYQYFAFHALCWNICWQNTIHIIKLALLLWIAIARGPEFDAAVRKSLAQLCFSNGKHFEDASLKTLRGIKLFRDENFASVMRQTSKDAATIALGSINRIELQRRLTRDSLWL